MPGALDALETGSVLITGEGRIVACCQRFAGFAGRTVDDLLGRLASDLMHPEDEAGARRRLGELQTTGASYVAVTHAVRPDEAGLLYESHVRKLFAEAPLILAVSRPFRGCLRPAIMPAEMVRSMGAYVVEMSEQLAAMAAQASMPVTCDLLKVAFSAGAKEVTLVGDSAVVH